MNNLCLTVYIKLIILYVIGRVLYHGFNLTCGYLDESQFNNSPCVLPVGHFGLCCTNWNFNDRLKSNIRFWYIFDNEGTYYSRAEISPKI